MDNLEDLKKVAHEDGIDTVIKYLSSLDNFSEEEISSLKEQHILSEDGYPCLSLIYSLVAIAE